MASLVFDPFEALGLPRDASTAAIKTRYHDLARKYHPNRTIVPPGVEGSQQTSHEHFHNVHQAWQILSKAENRRRRVELLNLLDLQDEMLAHYEDLLSEAATADQEDTSPERHRGAELEGYISSDADEDLPNVGIQRRQTVLSRESRGARRLAERRESLDAGGAPNSPKKTSKWHLIKSSSKPIGRRDEQKEADYFTLRRKKMEKLRRKELEAFTEYRNAMVAKFAAEEKAEKHHEEYERAKWRREYFERAPRGTTERMRSFQHFMGAVTAFEQHTPRQRNRSTVSYSTMSPVVAQGEGPSFLIPDHALGRQKTTHRRGWSSDISGDQTESSEDESGEAHGPKTPPTHWHEYSKRNKSLHFASFPFPRMHNANLVSSQEPASSSPGPFKLLVRRPTDLGSIVEARDSSGETVSGSSRSPSPCPSPQANGASALELGKFTIVRSNDTADLFGIPNDRCTRSPSPGAHRRSASPGRRAHDNAVGEGCQFATKQLGAPQHQQVPFAHVHLLTRHDKSRLLGSEPDTDTDPEALLVRLRLLNQHVASRFEVKPNMEQLFNFRLIYGSREVTPRQHQSFIALSYRRKLHVEKHQYHFTLPLEPEIFQAVWDERQSDTEGVWIDQICIDQEDDMERTISMSAMDMVYRSARLIVVALDDIELTAYEGALLQNHMDEYNAMTHVPPRQRFRHKQPPYLESHESLYKIVRKVLGSSWFRRAWCRHEMRLAKHHIFLIPSQSKNSSVRDVLRFNSKCIAHLLDLSTEVPFEPEVESVKPALHAFFRDRSKMTPDQRQMHLHHGNFSTVVAEVFAMQAGGDPRIPAEQRLSDARKDKVAIILNTMECGLALQQRFRLNGAYNRDSECFHDLSLLALAARDPGVLCSVGAPLVVDEAVGSWIFSPTVADAGLNNTKTLPRLPSDFNCVTKTSGAEHFIQLDLKFLQGGKAWRPTLDPDQDLLRLATRFTSVCKERKWGRNRKRYLTHDRKANLLFGPMQEVYVETLACILYCGPDWMGDVCMRYSMSRWKVDLRGACELLIALKNTDGKWPESAWNERAASFIMDFVNFLVIRGLPQRQISKPEQWRPCCVTMPTGGRVLTFTPVDRSVRPAIPSVLINPEYVHLARLWILKPKITSTSDHHHHDDEHVVDAISAISEWTLLGKAVLFSDELSIGQMYAYGGDFKEQQKVYGRHRQMSSSSSSSTSSNGVVIRGKTSR
ncbi:hypothetical protein DOTSEDRAFT_69957 [Lecanosticta acicola]|uniref:J domain-containing protein n=1 Tax=Lecanosticta acicola TaxID=111012 RepID=A0AAI8Z7R7_9PEZI|nr:hypothetical protein DOTSEDRAFT_69957 [Lecanosticta acicola]